MPATIAEARDQMCERLKTDVDASTFSNIVLLWDNAATDPEKPDPASGIPWARVNIKHTTGVKSAVGKAAGKERYTRGGFLIVQLFVPGNKGFVSHDQIVAMILAAYEGKTTVGGIVFKNCRHQEIGQDGPWHQTNIFVDFEYDDLH